MFYLRFVPLAGWILGMPWPGQFTAWLLGGSFFPAWLAFDVLTPSVWFNEEDVRFIGSDASAEPDQKEAEWSGEDVADDKR